jgi:hypothetical protein
VVEIYDIVGKEDVDGEPHYWVEWRRGLWCQARLRAQGSKKVEKEHQLAGFGLGWIWLRSFSGFGRNEE